MAKYPISYTCGHIGTVNLIGPHRSRESRIAYLEKGECFDCYKQHATATASEQAHGLELPALVGTEKQIAWAETLRIAKLTDIEAVVEQLSDHTEYRHILIAVETISNETSAKQWIEWRYDAPKQIISHVLAAMKAAPTQEQKQAEQEILAQAQAVKRAALTEATIRPETPRSELAAEISVQDKTVSVSLPEKREDFREIVKSLGYAWADGSWQRTIGAFAGTSSDRAIELGHILLSHGFLVRCFDEMLRAGMLSGTFEPEQTRWILSLITGEHTGWLAISWGRDEDWYDAAKKITDSRYSRPYVIAPALQFEQALDFAARYDFRVSAGAREAIEAAREEKEQMLVVVKRKPARTEKMPPVGSVPPVLIVPENAGVADELREEV